MASLQFKDDSAVIQFDAPDKKRRTIRLAPISESSARMFAIRLEQLLLSACTNLPPDKIVVEWACGLGASIREKFIEYGLFRSSLVNVCGYPPAPTWHIPIVRIGAVGDRIIPRKPGIYFLFDRNGRLDYVGKSFNIWHRLASSRHHKLIPGDEVAWLEFPRDRLWFAEAHYIAECEPRRNFKPCRVKPAFASV